MFKLIGNLIKLVFFLVALVAIVAVVSLYIEIPFVTEFVTGFLGQTPGMLAK